MKQLKLLSLMFFLLPKINAQITLIPDSGFEQALIDLGIDSDGMINGQVLTIEAGTGKITVNGLSTPIVMVQIFNAQWNQVFAFANKPDSLSLVVPNLNAGTYYVKVTLLNANWSTICSKDGNFIVFANTGTDCQNITNGGQISGDQTICKGETPTRINSIWPAAGGSGAVAAFQSCAHGSAGLR